jgi:hypothetical protein
MEASGLEWEAPRRGRIWARRLIAVAALAGTVAAFVSILGDAGPAATRTAALGPQLSRIETAGLALERSLGALHPGRSAPGVRHDLHEAVAVHRSVVGWVARMRADGRLKADDRLDNVLDADFEYLDAVGSVLANPRSPLRLELEARAGRARAALGSVSETAALAAALHGWRRLVTYTDARRRV